MKTVTMKFGAEFLKIELPDQTDVLSMATTEPLGNPAEALQTALDNPMGTPGLDRIIKSKLQSKPDARAVVVISDNTRPVPYNGESGILWPIIQKLLEHGFTRERILILVANGTHRALTGEDLQKMLDKRIFEHEITVKNHDCRDKNNLVYLGKTIRGSKIYINRNYIESDLKILTGLVESHFMAGVSGGRKSICPGLIGEEGTYVFHGAPMLASPYARDLQIENNPCHEEALEIAQKAGADFIVNVTLDPHFRISSIFTGDLEKAHQLAAERLKKDIGIKVAHEYDIVVTHAGFVGINHYQAAKAGVAAIPALKKGGRLILVANNTDINPVGSPNYRTVLHLLKLMGVEKFQQLLFSADWSFIPDQWQVQMWAKLFSKIPFDNFIYYSPQLAESEYQILPGKDGNLYLPAAKRYQGSVVEVAEVIEKAVQQAIDEIRAQDGEKASIAYLADGPYGIVMKDY